MPVKGDWDFDNPLGQAFRETLPAYAAFIDYAEMGPGRSMNSLWLVYRGENNNFPNISDRYQNTAPPTRRLHTIQDWASIFSWQSRIARNAEIETQEREERRRQRRIELEDANWDVGRLLRERCQEFTHLLEDFKQTRTETIEGPNGEEVQVIYLALNPNLDQVARALKIANELQQSSVEATKEENGKLNGGSLIATLIRELDGLVAQRQTTSSLNDDGD